MEDKSWQHLFNQMMCELENEEYYRHQEWCPICGMWWEDGHEEWCSDMNRHHIEKQRNIPEN